MRRFVRLRQHQRDPHPGRLRAVVHRVQIKREPSDRKRWRQVYVARAFGRIGGIRRVWTQIRETADAARAALRNLLRQIHAQIAGVQAREILGVS